MIHDESWRTSRLSLQNSQFLPLATVRNKRSVRGVALTGCLAFAGLTLSPSVGLAQEAGASEAAPKEVVITDKARAHFRAGVNLLQDPDGARYEEAYQQFKAAYAESPSWKILSNLGIAAMKLEKDGEAIEAFQKYLDEGGADVSEAEREQTQRDLDTLKTSVVTITIHAKPAGVRIVDERVGNQGGSIINQYVVPDSGEIVLLVRPGNHKLTARLAGYEDDKWEVTASAASSHEHNFELQKPDPKAGGSGGGGTTTDGGTYRPVPVSVWVGVGITGALTAGAVTTGILALGKNNKYDEANTDRDPGAGDLRKSVQTMNLVTDILIGSAVAAGAVTTVLYVLRPSVPLKTGLHFDPIVGPNLAALGVSGKF